MQRPCCGPAKWAWALRPATPTYCGKGGVANIRSSQETSPAHTGRLSYLTPAIYAGHLAAASGLAFAVGPVKQMHRPVESVFDECHAIPHSTRSLALLVAAAEVVYIAVVTHREIHEQGRIETAEDTVEVVGLTVGALNADK